MATRRNLTVVDQPRGRPPTGGGGGGGGGGKTPRARFKELAPKRVTDAINAVKYIEKLGNPAVYQYKASEAEQIVTAIRKAVDEVEYALRNPGKATPILSFEDE